MGNETTVIGIEGGITLYGIVQLVLVFLAGAITKYLVDKRKLSQHNADEINGLSAQAAAIIADGDITPEEKRALLDEIYEHIAWRVSGQEEKPEEEA
jgi:hypothetical protein